MNLEKNLLHAVGQAPELDPQVHQFVKTFVVVHGLRYKPSDPHFSPRNVVLVVYAVLVAMRREMLPSRIRNFLCRVRQIALWFRGWRNERDAELAKVTLRWEEFEEQQRKLLRHENYKDCRLFGSVRAFQLKTFVKLHVTPDQKRRATVELYWSKRMKFRKKFHEWFDSYCEVRSRHNAMSSATAHHSWASPAPPAVHLPSLASMLKDLESSRPRFRIASISPAELVAFERSHVSHACSPSGQTPLLLHSSSSSYSPRSSEVMVPPRESYSSRSPETLRTVDTGSFLTAVVSGASTGRQAGSPRTAPSAGKSHPSRRLSPLSERPCSPKTPKTGKPASSARTTALQGCPEDSDSFLHDYLATLSSEGLSQNSAFSEESMNSSSQFSMQGPEGLYSSPERQGSGTACTGPTCSPTRLTPQSPLRASPRSQRDPRKLSSLRCPLGGSSHSVAQAPRTPLRAALGEMSPSSPHRVAFPGAGGLLNF